MEYMLMQPPFQIKSFDELSKKEAEQHFEWFMQEIPSRIEYLKDFFVITNGGSKDRLDFSPDSLKILWEWFINHVELVSKTKEEIDEEKSSIPEIFKGSIEVEEFKLSTKTSTLALDIAIYFAEVFLNKFEAIQWGYVTKPKKLVYVNKPVLVGFGNFEMDITTIVTNLTFKVAKGDNTSNSLFDLLNVWKKYLTVERGIKFDSK